MLVPLLKMEPFSTYMGVIRDNFTEINRTRLREKWSSWNVYLSVTYGCQLLQMSLSSLFSLSNLSVSWLKWYSSVAKVWIKLQLLGLEMVQN